MLEIGKNISANLRKLRKNRQLTLEELAEKSSVSKSMLGEIERGNTNPTINVLWKIAQALKTPLTNLIGTQEEGYTVVRDAARIPLGSTSGYEISSVFPYYEPHRMELLSLELEPGAKLENSGHMQGVEEYLLVLEGSVSVTVQRDKVALGPRDAMRFAADAAHAIENVSETKARILNIIHYS